eukprot:TRINITY_DN10908_c0_g2_i1.p1 TRINITY_DN10908_c0_g2~~TRINITY_DN10908_c0_g2_i1.p1  ORF type:complete len:222 (+),score=37.52 TRINITY_DN10908_c0_g2_i1:41-706(+)
MQPEKVVVLAVPVLLLVFYIDYWHLHAKFEAIANPARWGRLRVSAKHDLEVASFTMGGFWEGQPVFDEVAGVAETMVGYMGGSTQHPVYTEAGTTGHFETVRVVFNSSVVTYEKLLEVFWANTDPTNPTGQFCNTGTSYTPTIFYHTRTQHNLANLSLSTAATLLHTTIYTRLVPTTSFYPAEEPHQFMYLKNPEKYQQHVKHCKRKDRLESVWKGRPVRI